MTARTLPMVLDPGTSTAAGALQTTAHKQHVKAVITALLSEHGPLTDDQLVELYRERAHAYTSVPLVTPQSVRTRRSELVHEGHVREAGLGKSALGNRASTWTLA